MNSNHHMAIDEVAPGFIVTARCPDGVIEAIEYTEEGQPLWALAPRSPFRNGDGLSHHREFYSSRKQVCNLPQPKRYDRGSSFSKLIIKTDIEPSAV